MALHPIEKTCLVTIDRFGMLPRGSAVGVAVSGGADSVALFRLLAAYSASRGWRLVILHVNHQLRGAESDADAQFVLELAAQHQVDFVSTNLPVSRRGNLEQQARKLRFEFFENCTSSHNLEQVALGHTRSDQAETVLFRFLRGSGTAGLAGIQPVLGNHFVRPLLDVTRNEIRKYLQSLGQNWREDSTNLDTAFDRNRIRHDLLPQLAREWNPMIEDNLAQVADRAREEEQYWAEIVHNLAQLHFKIEPGPAVVLKSEAILQQPAAVARRLVRHAFRVVRGDLQSVEFDHVERARAMALPSRRSGRVQIPGVEVTRSFDWLRFGSPEPTTFIPPPLPVHLPGEFRIPEAHIHLLLQVGDAHNLYTGNVDCLDADRVPERLDLRTWRSGDSLQPVGRRAEGKPTTVKLKSLLAENRIPRWERRTWPVLSSGEDVVWTRRFGADVRFAASSATSRIVRVIECFAPVPDVSMETGIRTGRQASKEVEDATTGPQRAAEIE